VRRDSCVADAAHQARHHRLRLASTTVLRARASSLINSTRLWFRCFNNFGERASSIISLRDSYADATAHRAASAFLARTSSNNGIVACRLNAAAPLCAFSRDAPLARRRRRSWLRTRTARRIFADAALFAVNNIFATHRDASASGIAPRLPSYALAAIEQHSRYCVLTRSCTRRTGARHIGARPSRRVIFERARRSWRALSSLHRRCRCLVAFRAASSLVATPHRFLLRIVFLSRVRVMRLRALARALRRTIGGYHLCGRDALPSFCAALRHLAARQRRRLRYASSLRITRHAYRAAGAFVSRLQTNRCVRGRAHLIVFS